MSPHSSGRIKDRTRETAEIEPSHRCVERAILTPHKLNIYHLHVSFFRNWDNVAPKSVFSLRVNIPDIFRLRKAGIHVAYSWLPSATLQNFEFPNPSPLNLKQCRVFSPPQGQRIRSIPLYSTAYSLVSQGSYPWGKPMTCAQGQLQCRR